MPISTRSPDADPNPYKAPARKSLDPVEIARPDDGAMPLSAVLVYYFFGIFFASAVFWGLPFSLAFSRSRGRDFLSVLISLGLPGGLLFGLLMAVVVTSLMGVYWRRRTATISFTDRTEFLARLERELPGRRFRMSHRSKSSIVFAPRAMIRAHVSYIFVEVEDGSATVVGPKGFVDLLCKRLREV
jgi:hypothetical protein